MSDEIKIKVVKSPFIDGTWKNTWTNRMTINITLSNGMIITNPEQFEYEHAEEYLSEETMAP